MIRVAVVMTTFDNQSTRLPHSLHVDLNEALRVGRAWQSEQSERCWFSIVTMSLYGAEVTPTERSPRYAMTWAREGGYVLLDYVTGLRVTRPTQDLDGLKADMERYNRGEDAPCSCC